MSRARFLLHLAALIAPLGAACLWNLVMYRVNDGFALNQFAIFGGLGALAAEISAALRWPALERRAREGGGAWLTGLGMAVLTHVLFGVLFVGAIVIALGGWRAAAGTGSPFDLVLQAAFFFVMSLSAVGVVTFPATACLAHALARLRRRELGLADADAHASGGAR